MTRDVTVRLRQSFGWDAMCGWTPFGGRSWYRIPIQRIFPLVERNRLWAEYHNGNNLAEIDFGKFDYCYITEKFSKMTEQEKTMAKAMLGKKILWVEQ